MSKSNANADDQGAITDAADSLEAVARLLDRFPSLEKVAEMRIAKRKLRRYAKVARDAQASKTRAKKALGTIGEGLADMVDLLSPIVQKIRRG